MSLSKVWATPRKGQIHNGGFWAKLQYKLKIQNKI